MWAKRVNAVVEWPVRKLVWAFDLEDGSKKNDPSLTKGLALLFGVLVVVAVLLEKTVAATHVVLATVALAAAFGRSMFKAYLGRGNWGAQLNAQHTSTTAKTQTVTETIARQIIERRDAALGVDPTHD